MKAGVAVVGCLLLVACGGEEQAPEPIRPVLSMPVQIQDALDLGRFAGTIQARYESTLGFRVGGRIARRWVDVGATVKPGDVLASLDPTDQQNQLRAAEGDLARIQAQWINAQANARRQQQLYDRGGGEPGDDPDRAGGVLGADGLRHDWRDHCGYLADLVVPASVVCGVVQDQGAGEGLSILLGFRASSLASQLPQGSPSS